MDKKKIIKAGLRCLFALAITVLTAFSTTSTAKAASYKRTSGIIQNTSTSSSGGSITFRAVLPPHTTLNYEIFEPVHDSTHRGSNDYSDSAVKKVYKLTGKQTNSSGKPVICQITRKVYHYGSYSVFAHYTSGSHEIYEVRKNVRVKAPAVTTWYSGWLTWSKADYARYRQKKTHQTIRYVAGNLVFDLALAYTGAGITKGAKDAVTVGSRITRFAVAVAGWLKNGKGYVGAIRNALNGDGYLAIKSYMQQGQSTRLKFVRRSGGSVELYIQGKNSAGETVEKKIKTIPIQNDTIIRMTPDDITAFDLS